MAKLTTPEAIAFSYEKEKRQITISFTGVKDDQPVYPDNLKCDIRIIQRYSPEVVIGTEKGQTAILQDKTYTITITAPEKFEESKQTVQVMAIADSPDDNSEWGAAAFWVVSPSLTLLIGTFEVVLSQDTFKKVRTFKLPAPVDITYDDITAFAGKIGLNLPETFPDGSRIADLMILHIQNIFVDLDNRLFDLDFSIVIPENSKINVIPNLRIKQVGIMLKRTDGSF